MSLVLAVVVLVLLMLLVRLILVVRRMMVVLRMMVVMLVLMLLLTLMPVISMGAGILISHAVGAKDQARANRIFNEAFGASMILISLIGAFAWLQRDSFGLLMTSDPATAALIATYTRWFIPSIVVQLPLFVIAGALEFTGNVRVGTIAQTATVILNATLTPILKQRVEQKGFVLVHWGHGGWLQVFSKQPVATVADLKKAKLYTSAGDDTMTQWYKANGFQPRAMAMTTSALVKMG